MILMEIEFNKGNVFYKIPKGCEGIAFNKKCLDKMVHSIKENMDIISSECTWIKHNDYSYFMICRFIDFLYDIFKGIVNPFKYYVRLKHYMSDDSSLNETSEKSYMEVEEIMF